MLHPHRLSRIMRCGTLLLAVLLLLGLSGAARAQNTNTLKACAFNTQMGSVSDVEQGPDGLVYLVSEGGGLWVYARDNSQFRPQAYLPVPGERKQLENRPDGAIYVGCEWGGLAAYRYTNSTLTEIARACGGSTLCDFEVEEDGIIFTAAGIEGLIAYRLDGEALVRLAQYNDGSNIRAVAVDNQRRVYAASGNGTLLSVYRYDGNGFTCLARIPATDAGARDLPVDRDGNVFLTDVAGGLHAFRYDGHELRRTAYIGDGPADSEVSATPDGTVCVLNAVAGLRVYEYNGTDFRLRATWSCPEVDMRNISLADDGSLLVANGADGLRVLEWKDESLQCSAHVDQQNRASGVAIGPGGDIFLANGSDGLRAYRAGEPFLNCRAHRGGEADGIVDARDVAVDGQNHVYLAHDNDVSVYVYTGGSFVRIAHAFTAGPPNAVTVDVLGRVYVSCGEFGLQVFLFDGRTIRPIALVNDGGQAMGVAINADGAVFLANANDGLRAYRWIGENLNCVAHARDGAEYFDWAQKVAAGPDNSVFLANGQDGLRAYRLEGNTLVPTARLEFLLGGYYAGATSLTVGPEGTIFFGYTAYHTMDADGIYACSYDGSSFTVLAHAAHSDHAMNLAVSADRIVYLADRRGGLLAYRYAPAPGAPQIAADKKRVDFGRVLLGHTGLQTVTVSNTGEQPLRILSQDLIRFGREEFYIAYSLPSEIPAGRSATMGVIFLPWSEGEKAAMLRITSNDPNQAQLNITTTASARATPEPPLPPHIGRLWQNNPNPFNPSTQIRYFLGQDEHVTMRVFDLAGRPVRTLVDEDVRAGWHTVAFDAGELPSGVYLYRLETAGQVLTRRMVLLK